jgi:ArsR family transcriptional regulator, arsenate/arsenite/antimonite-responsive transcriptional repressor
MATKLDVLKALADETRLHILKKMTEEGSRAPTSSCSSGLELSQPTISHHLKVLHAAGIIKEKKGGTSKSYTIDKTFLKKIGVDITKVI